MFYSAPCPLGAAPRLGPTLSSVPILPKIVTEFLPRTNPCQTREHLISLANPAHPLFNPAFDYEAATIINALDLAQFRKRYGLSFSY